MRFLIFLTFLGLAATWSLAQTAPEDSLSNNPADTASANLATLSDVNIFSQMPLGSIYVLWSNFDLSVDIKNKITNHSFVLEPFYMQNIDREQFEQNNIINLFEEQRRVFFKLFPDDEED